MNRHAFFEQLACAPDPLAFKPEHELRIERLRQRLGDLRGKRVFEPGCGAGPLTVRLAGWVGPAGQILALDASPGMVARCQRTVANHAHVRTIHAKAEDARLAPGAWDLILCFRLFPHLEDPGEFLRRCRIGIAPGGELIIANLEGSTELNAWHAQRSGVHRDRMPAGPELRRRLQAEGWQVAETIDEPGEFFLRAQPV
jgi:2-polyprenyl-3-methyl-5-hydroxy-6-metoxy-1,4-benzoquinol methylase